MIDPHLKLKLKKSTRVEIALVKPDITQFQPSLNSSLILHNEKMRLQNMTFEPNVQLNKHIKSKASKVLVVDPVA